MEIDEDLFYSVPLVIAVTEGPTDIPYLKLPLNAHFKEKYGYQCKTISLGGDVTSDMYLNDDFLTYHAKFIEGELHSSRDKVDDDVAKNIQEVVQIIDIDQVFIDDDLVTEDESKEEFYYTREGTQFKNKESVLKRNSLKIERIPKRYPL